MTTNFKNYKS